MPLSEDEELELLELEEAEYQAGLLAEKSKPVGPSEWDSAGRGLAQGASFGLRDEGAGFLEAPMGGLKEIANKFGAEYNDSDVSDYKRERDASRSLDVAARLANPKSFAAGELGGAVATSFIPGMGVAKGASLLKNVGNAAAQGLAYGVGASDSENVGDLARDAVVGAGVGGAGGAIGHGISAGLSAVASKLPSSRQALNKGLAKQAGLFAGIDEDAALRALERPAQLTAADADGAAYNLAKRAQEHLQARGEDLGTAVGSARDSVVRSRGAEIVPGTESLVGDAGNFLSRNNPSKAGFSGITANEAETLTQLRGALQNANAEDLVKFREYIDNQVSHLYGRENAATPFQRQLMKMRGQADSALDAFDPALNQANKDYSRFVEDKNVLGIGNERTMESVADNLYSGANKTAKQQAAERLLPADMIGEFRDVAANKAFENAKKPGGDGYFRRGAMGVLTLGGSELVTNPSVQKFGLKTIGQIQDGLSNFVKNNPKVLGKFAPILQDASSRGPQALAATHFILGKQNPEYREMMRQLEGMQEE